MIEILNEVNQILNIVKAKFGLKTKSEAIARVVAEYGSEILEPGLRPEFVNEMGEIEKGKHFEFKNLNDLRKQIER